MLTLQQALDIQGALMTIRLQHPWHFDEDIMTYICECSCSRCEGLGELIVAILACTETDAP